MNDFTKYKATFLKKDGTFTNYKYDAGMHKEIMEDYCQKQGYNGDDEQVIIDNGNIFFRNAGNNMFIIYMPNELTEFQLYQLELISPIIDELEFLAVSKTNKTYEFDDNIWSSFSNVIQTYYEKDKKI